jgi:hypothetical protein
MQALQNIVQLSSNVSSSEIADDLEAENDSMDAAISNESNDGKRKGQGQLASALCVNIKTASQGVVVASTLKGYNR